MVTPRTGETHKTSAASLVLFDKDKNVIWKAPRRAGNHHSLHEIIIHR
jgi:hypothetical protein